MLLTKRGQVVFVISVAINLALLFAGLVWVMDHINWMGDHYCFHSSIECYFGKE